MDRKQFYAIKNALTAQEKKLISFYELQWFLKQNIPTIEEVATYLDIKQVAVNYYLQRRPVTKALESRGIPWKQHTQDELTATQVAAAQVMMNFSDTRSNDEKLDQLGINPNQYQAWLLDPQFKNLVDSLADQNLRNIRPTAVTEFTKKINQGDWNAIKYFLDVTGELQTQDAPQSEVLIKMFVEIIQKHVKDPEVIMAIAQDVKLAAANRTLEVVAQPHTPPMQITGEVIEDPELEQARRMLGV